MTILIGLTGRARSGKDSVADVLEARGFHRVAFAAKMKRLLLAANPHLEGLVREHGWEGAKASKDGPLLRAAMQSFGAAARRELGPDVWLAPVEYTIRYHLPYTPVVVTDVRHPNEEALIRTLGGRIWRVTRPGTLTGDTDPTEMFEAEKVDQDIHNTGTLEDLEGEVWRALEA